MTLNFNNTKENAISKNDEGAWKCSKNLRLDFRFWSERFRITNSGCVGKIDEDGRKNPKWGLKMDEKTGCSCEDVMNSSGGVFW